jgi:histidine kinase
MRARIILLIMFAAFSLVAIALGWYAMLAWQLADLKGRADEGLSLKSRNVTTEVERFRYLPRVVEHDARIRQLLMNPSDPTAVDLANRYLEAINQVAGSDKLYVLDTDGNALASSNWGEPKSFVGQAYGFRPYFLDAMKSGSGHYYAQGVTTGEPGYFLAHRIEAAGRTVGVSVVKVNMSPLESAWKAARENVALIDSAGMIFLSSVADWKFRPLYPLSAEDRNRIVADKQYSPASISRPALFSEGEWALGPDLYVPSGGGTALIWSRAIPTENWRILASFDVSGVYRAAALVATIVFLTAALLFAVGVYLSERRQRAQADELRAFLAHMGVGIGVFDSDFRLLAWNNSYIRLNSYPESLIRVGRPLAEITRFSIERGDYGPGDPAKQLQDRLDHVRREAVSQIEVRRPDGTWVEIKRNRMPGERFIHTYNDITERKRDEVELAAHRNNLEELVGQRTAELIKLNERLQQSMAQTDAAKHRAEQANQAKTTFLNAVSHDIRNPLTAILGYAGLVMAGAKDVLPDRQYANLEKLASKGRELNEMISDLLDYARADRINLATFQLRPVIEECLVTVEPLIDAERVQVSCEVAKNLPSLVQDERKLRRIIVNLLSNAAKFTERGSIRISARLQDGAVEISVADTGVGIAEEFLGRIFDEFERIEPPGQRPREGTGLGLAISQRFARLIGGKLTVQSDLGAGSIFTLSCPITHERADAGGDVVVSAISEEADRAPAGSHPAAVDGEAKATVLVVDDSRENRDFLTQLLETSYRILTAVDGRKAVEIAFKERPDIILMDLSLPLMDGWEATQKIKHDVTLRSTPIIAVTANATRDDRERAFAAGCDDFLTKPIDVQSLLDAIKQHLASDGRGA